MTSRRETIVYLAGVEWTATKGTDRHLVEHLSRSVDVLWVEPPFSVREVARRRDYDRLRRLTDVRQVMDGVWQVNVLAPPFAMRPGVTWVSERLLRGGLHRLVSRRGIRVAGVVVSSPYVSFDVAPRPAGGRRLYYATDDFVAGAELMRQSRGALAAAERRRVTEADVVAGVTPAIVERWESAGKCASILPNGCDTATYAEVDRAPLPPDAAIDGPVAGVVGQLSARIDLQILEEVASRDVHLLLVGPLVGGLDPDRFRRLVARPNVTWVGEKPFEQLPSYLRRIDVGLTPYVDNAFNRASFPLKTLEYLAAGRPAVSTPLPATTSLGTEHVSTAAAPREFADRVVQLTRITRTPEQVAARQAFAATHSWEHRATQLRDLVLRS